MIEQMRTGFSVVIPTCGRETYVQRLLASLRIARDHYKGAVEVIVVDSSDKRSAKWIEECCTLHGAIYQPGEQSVRWKRNHGVSKAGYPIILFIDSDCEVDVNIFNEHARIYESGVDCLGGVYGLTRFRGKRSFLWRIIELTPFIHVFSFAECYPYVQWAIGNNISFYRTIFCELGGFDESFPFRLGGDDLDLSLRLTTAGYWLQTNPKAVTYHTRDTWNRWSVLLERAVRWGRMEYYLACKHPQLLRRGLPEQGPVFLAFALAALVLTIATGSYLPIMGLLLWALASYLLDFLWTRVRGEKIPFMYYTLARIPITVYEASRLVECLRHKRLDIPARRMVFSAHHLRSVWPKEVRRLWIALMAFWIVLLFYSALVT